VEPFEWSPDDLVFVTQMDADHQKLIREIEAVRKALAPATPTTEAGFRCWQLSKCLSAHLVSEERMMRRSRYPASQWHASQHNAGRTKMARLVAAIQGKDVPHIEDALRELGHWMKDHIALADRMLAAHLRNDSRERLVS
jgi:hemerythrin-like metal-binding protein